MRIKIGRQFRAKICSQGPIFSLYKCVDFALAFNHQTHRDGLHATSGQSASYLVPQQWRNFVTDYSIQDSAGLLGINEIVVEHTWLLKRGQNRGLGYLVEHNA